VSDSGSRNGTQLSGAWLTVTILLADGDQIKAGRLSIRYTTRAE
jgi:hypothetical protein